MARRHYNLPPLTTLAAFEAAARHLSFKDAAQELSVTPGAVSHQIKALEGELGAALFRRKHRQVELTEKGQKVFEALSASFLRVSHVLQSVRSDESSNTATIGSSAAISALYLSRAMIRFWRDHPDMQVNQVAQDHAFLGGLEPDLFIRYGVEPDDGLEYTELYRDVLVPVGDRATADRLTGASLEELAKQRLIQLDATDTRWTAWAEWFRALGYTGPVKASLRVNNYAIALQTAREGAGLALGWQRLLFPLLQARKLIPIGPHVLTAPHSFYLASQPEEDLSEAAKALKHWILEDTARITHELNSPMD